MRDPRDTRAEHLARLLQIRGDVRNFLASKGLTGDALDDAVQSVMATAIESLPNYREEQAKFIDWVFGIAANIARVSLRHQRRGQASSAPDYVLDDAAIEPRSSPERLALLQQIMAKVGRALAGMPETLLSVLLVVSVEEASHEATAARLQISPAVSKKRLERARRYLEKESGVSRKDLRAALPLLFCATEQRRLTLGRLDMLANFARQGQHALALVPVLLVLWPSPVVQTARTGLSYRLPQGIGVVADAGPTPATVVDVAPPAPAPRPAKAAKHAGKFSSAPTSPPTPLPSATSSSIKIDVDPPVHVPVP